MHSTSDSTPVAERSSLIARVLISPFRWAVEALGRASRRTRTSLLSLSDAEVGFDRRGFPSCRPDSTAKLERVGLSFLTGFRVALLETNASQRAGRLDAEVADEWRGFAYEGAAFGCALLDGLTPWHAKRWAEFADGPAASHIYMAHVGYGMARAELPWGRERGEALTRRLSDPLLRWLAIDGYGFHHGYFFRRRWREVGQVRNPYSGLSRRVFDQGLGRSLWFASGADIRDLARLIHSQNQSRHGDLWAGVGLAAAYAGGVDAETLASLVSLAGSHRHDMAQGVAFAAQARRRADIPAAHTALACEVVWGRSADTVGGITDECLIGLPPDSDGSVYEAWRSRIRSRHAVARPNGESP